MHRLNRRRHPRIYRPVEVKYSYGEDIFSESTMSLSMGGLYVKTNRPLEIDSLFLVDFTLPGFDHTFKIMGKVIWIKSTGDAHGPPGMGVKFLNVPEENKKALLQFLAASQVTQQEM